MKKLSCLLTVILVICLLTGCAGTPVVYYSNCTCPEDSHQAADTPVTLPAAPQLPVVSGGLKTGVSFTTSLSDSVSAAGETAGEAKYDVSMVAVLVDEDGIIHDCVIDGISASIQFDATGAITTELTPVQTKNEQGVYYGMVAYGNAVAEWDAQAAAVANFVIGKKAADLATGVVDETGHAVDADLATSATIYIGGYVNQIMEAAANAQHLGAQSGDKLKLATVTDRSSSVNASAEAAGNAQLDVTITALTMAGDTITSCYIDGVQAKVGFDTTGTITTDLAAPQTKNQLGDSYGMVAWGGAIAEWNQQAASLAAYVTGKTAGEVTGIAVDESTRPTEADLATSVTIAIGGFQALIAKACAQ